MNIIICKEKSIKKKDKKMKYWEIGEKNRFGIECYKLHLKLENVQYVEWKNIKLLKI